MLVCLRRCKEFLLILLSDHCKSDALFHQENQVYFAIDKHHVSESEFAYDIIIAYKSNLRYRQYSKPRLLEVLRSCSNKIIHH